MTRLIDAIELRKEVDKLQDSNPWNHDEVYRAHVEEIVELAPTVDAEPVIRCKDCIFSYLDEDILVCGQFRAFVEPDGFCSSGKCEVKE